MRRVDVELSLLCKLLAAIALDEMIKDIGAGTDVGLLSIDLDHEVAHLLIGDGGNGDGLWRA